MLRRDERGARAALPCEQFVGLSKVREAHVFGGLPIVERFDESQRECGIHVVDLETGQHADFLRFLAGCSEIFDIQVLNGMRWPTVVGFQGTALDGILIAPPALWQRDAPLAFGEQGD